MATVNLISNNKIIRKLENPAIIYDLKSGLVKIGEIKEVQETFTSLVDRYKLNGFSELADDLRYLELPHDEELIDKIFNISGYILTVHKNLNLE